MKCVSVALLVYVSAVPAQAQYQWPYYPGWPGFEQPRPHVRSRPRAKPLKYRTKTVTVVKRESWRGMSQDRAREWLKGQAQEFCQKYQSDVACQRPAKE